MNNSLVSVVMPVYNTGVLLKESIGSLLNQTYTNIELLCVDDASNDTLTKEILAEYLNADARVKLIVLEKNIGAGGARNIGLEAAEGKYILFFDSDDYAFPSMLEKLINQCEKNELDLCICSAVVCDVESKGYITSIIHKEERGTTDGYFSVKNLSEDALLHWNTAPWNKLFRLDFVKEISCHFQEIASCNDVYFTIMCAMKATRIMYCENGNPLVEYRKGRSNQISRNKKISDLFLAFDKLFQDLKDVSNEEKNQLVTALIYLSIAELMASKDIQEKKKLYGFVSDFIRNQVRVEGIKSEKTKEICISFRDEKFESGWFEKNNNDEIDIHSVLKQLIDQNAIIIWGYGHNGVILDRKIHEMECSKKIYVTDKKDIMLGRKTQYESTIIETKSALEMDAALIATNKEIYEYLSEILKDNTKKILIKGWIG
ncbi:glycosyltransferase family 2 protein [Pseudobutyrivibrio xylanivorans]|uniref:Glycosyltransferase involved in cell wall bisynthesis n=1 Tax=Pseudobutyrivibrio xylanivorans DSM 14809 TaxID=1123012 RepID=A0A1M6DA35_PSEXY|nr:glycosyltransferase family 2 protein [Pseudobutyrivibrio xylanivorans]SHI70015.1 Glycosyltransferase involved in cell wall bisynthesis [Pseudobutyrivibrio xylanivorans DSM 14809]